MPLWTALYTSLVTLSVPLGLVYSRIRQKKQSRWPALTFGINVSHGLGLPTLRIENLDEF